MVLAQNQPDNNFRFCHETDYPGCPLIGCY